MELKTINPKSGQGQIAKELGLSSSTLQLSRRGKNMLSPYTIPSNSYKRTQKILITRLDEISHREHDIKRPQMTSTDLKRTQKIELFTLVSNANSTVNRTAIKKNKLQGGSVHEIDEEFSDENLHNNNLQGLHYSRTTFLLTKWNYKCNLSLMMKVKNITVKSLKGFNSHFFVPQVKKRRQLASMMPAIKKAFDSMGDDIVKLATEKECLKIKLVLRRKIVRRIQGEIFKGNY